MKNTHMAHEPFQHSELPINAIITLMSSASDILLSIFKKQDYWRKKKPDGTWVSEADIKANDYISAGIRKMCPDIPLISEEDLKDSKANLSRFFLLDPLDGTNQLINGHKDFCICLALIEEGIPTLGFIFHPATENCWVGGTSIKGTWSKHQSKWKLVNAKARNKPDIESKGIHIIKGLQSIIKKEVFEQRLNCKVEKMTLTGSALKMAYISEGRADVYLRIFPIKQWDIAAGHAILKSAGADLVEIIVLKENNTYIIKGYKDFKYGLKTQNGENNWASSSFCCAHNTTLEALFGRYSNTIK